MLEPKPDLEEHLEHPRDFGAFYGVSCRLGTTAFDFILVFCDELVSKLTYFLAGGIFPTLEEFVNPYGLCFKLDEEFRAKKRLFTMDGNEKMSLDRWSHIDHLSGEKTFWDLDGEWFYHITSHNTVVNKYNVRTGKSRSFAHLNLKDRIITDEVKLQLMDVASNMTERFDKIHEAFVDVEILPLFQDFTVHNNDYYMVIYNPSSVRDTEIIKVNEISGEVQYVNLPLSLWKVKAGRKMIYGTVTYGEDAQIRLIKFSE